MLEENEETVMIAVKSYSVYNNMYFRTAEGKIGYIKADGENVALFSLDEYTLSRTTGERIPKVLAKGFIPEDITLIPRNIETFNEFRAGDVLCKRPSAGNVEMVFATVVARFSNTIVLENLGNFKEVTDIHKAFADGWRLNPTVFEQELLEESLLEKEEDLLVKGDLIIFKRCNLSKWIVGRFNRKAAGCVYVDFLQSDETEDSILATKVLKLTPERIEMIGTK